MSDSLTLIYPNDSLANYDIDYLVDKHMPMMQSRWRSSGLTSWNVTKFTPSPEGNPPVYALAATLSWDKPESVPGMGGDVDIDKIMEDMAQFSDKRPIILSGEAVGEGHQ